MVNDKKKAKKRKVERIQTKNLPQVVMEDILSRLPVKSLLRFRCVCKAWCALISDPFFVKIHINQSLASSSNPSLLLTGLVDLYSVELNVCEQEVAKKLHLPLKALQDITVLGSCNGLLCISISKDFEDDIILWNPSTRRHQKLLFTPIEVHVPYKFRVKFGFSRFIGYGFGYEPTTGDYKLVMFAQASFDDGYTWHSEGKVYSLITNSWKRIGDMDCCLTTRLPGVLANSALHWIADRVKGPFTPPSIIVSFDLKNEEFGEVPLPEFVDSKFHMTVGVLGGKLCMVCNFERVCVEVWIMKDYGIRDSWEKQFSIKQPSRLRSFMSVSPICYSKNGEIVLAKASGELFMYDPRRGRVRKLRIRGDLYKDEAKICIGSLVPLNAKDGIEQPDTNNQNGERRKEKGRKAYYRLWANEDFALIRLHCRTRLWEAKAKWKLIITVFGNGFLNRVCS
ncbi:F-box protein CPR1-like [Telopea speciosissima]|uniref:F-box protein CPR1-like n=1 Tax=Telopea speciosissima TaxID=54955 RepID=UPI001CC40820|nr:F-box protein CPR1-like [Telopea speciosissima]